MSVLASSALIDGDSMQAYQYDEQQPFVGYYGDAEHFAPQADYSSYQAAFDYPPPLSYQPASGSSFPFQMPAFMQVGPPTLAPGGGAEVLPPGTGSAWMSNSGFAGGRVEYNTHRTEQAVEDKDEPPAALEQEQTSAPFDYSENTVLQTSTISSSLPLYSQTGFDLLSLIARVVHRPNPQLLLGPVDMTTSFLVVDTRRHDHPVVYVSPTFSQLTLYPESHIIGRNCRFLQAPPGGGEVRKGEQRRWVSNEKVGAMRKAINKNQEVRLTLVNYRKNGEAFINLVTIIPVPEEHGESVYQMGFQVDLTRQPQAILEKLKEGSYEHHVETHPATPKKATLPPLVVSSKLVISNSIATPDPSSHPLTSLLLAATPDLLLVVSLKGVFLYVSPSSARILGYPSNKLVGMSLSDIAHERDVVPLMRELKNGGEGKEEKKGVDLLFRAKKGDSEWIWLECRGRLHSEPGKGRKAIILSARAYSDFPHIPGEDIDLRRGAVHGLVSNNTITASTPNSGLPVGQKLGAEHGAVVWGARVFQISPSPPNKNLHPVGDLFAELRMERGTSWQYELQQLRMRNARLGEMIRDVEGGGTPTPKFSVPATPTTSTGYAYPQLNKQYATSPSESNQSVPVSVSVQMPLWGVKRSWDAVT